MINDDVIRMAKEAGWEYANGDDGYDPLWRFAELVAAAEREACAKVFDKMAEEAEYEREPSSVVNYYRAKATAIRARGQE